jgi:hypothetical protein
VYPKGPHFQQITLVEISAKVARRDGQRTLNALSAIEPLTEQTPFAGELSYLIGPLLMDQVRELSEQPRFPVPVIDKNSKYERDVGDLIWNRTDDLFREAKETV